MTPPIEPTVRMRACAGCDETYPTPHGGDWPARFHSRDCYRDFKRAEAPKPRRTASLVTRESAKPKRRTFTPASDEQRIAVALQPCLMDASHHGVEPAHLIDRMMLTVGQEDPRAVVPLCRACHREYDDGDLDLLPYLEPRFSVELAFAVERFGLISTLRRVTNDRWQSSETGYPLRWPDE